MSKSSSPDACRLFRSRLSDLLGSEASAEEVAEADSHRSACAECEAEYALAVKVEQSFAALPDFMPGAGDTALEDRMFSATAKMIGRVAMDPGFDPTKPVVAEISCRDFRDKLGDFVSEELPVNMLLEGVEHAGECRPCGDQLTELSTIQDACRSLAEVEPPASIWTSLMARIDAEEAAQAAAEGATETAKKKAPGAARSKLLPVLG